MKTKIQMLFLALLASLVIVGSASGQTVLGRAIRVDKVFGIDAGTCGALTEGVMVTQLGGDAGAGDTKLCICSSDGGDAYRWCSITLTGGSNVVCTLSDGGASAWECP